MMLRGEVQHPARSRAESGGDRARILLAPAMPKPRDGGRRGGQRTMTAVLITVLVAEDHPGYRARLAGLLDGWGLRTVTAADGRAALRALADGMAFDLLVTDLDMPHHTGFEVIEAWLRRGGRAEAVIMVTGEADARDVRERCAAGGICLIHKAAIDVRFEEAVRAALRRLDERRGGGA
jgi:CheY-like chemotaxis protein